MNTVIELENMEFHSCHGCYALEKVVGNRFQVSVVIEAEVGDAAREDDLRKSIDYLAVYDLVRGQMDITSDILENVALRIVEAILETFPQASRARAKVSKLAPPLGGKVARVSVTIEKSSSGRQSSGRQSSGKPLP